MASLIARLICACFMITFICACAPFHFNDKRAGVCNQLNSELVFGGGTSITREAEIENAELPLAQKMYDKKCE